MRFSTGGSRLFANGLMRTSLILLVSQGLIAAGSFANPASSVRPRFRYILPDASVDPEIVSADIAGAASVGAGGIEFLPFYEYGGSLGPMPAGANWSTYNFGTAPFKDLFSAALTAHEQHGLLMDFALGPNQGQGVPASADNPGLQWDLLSYTGIVPSDGQFSGLIPGWGNGTLVSLVSALVISNKTLEYESVGTQGPNVTYEYDQYVLSSESLTDETAGVAGNGTIQLFFEPTSGKHYRLFAFYEKLTGHKNIEFSSTVDNSIFDEGSYTVDHFDNSGAGVIIDFWKEHILDDGIREQLRRVGHYGWEDSLELVANVSWSRSVPSRFEEIFGYSILPYLPLLAFQQIGFIVQAASPGPFQCLLDTETQGDEHIHAFRATLTAGYQEYVRTLKNWLNSELGLELSLQPGYGQPINAQATVPDVDVPECESLTFEDSIDSYRQFVGPAHLARRNIVSNELGAAVLYAFRYTLPQLLFSANRGFVGGVNQYILHVQPYSGNYYETTWPGHTPFNYLFSEAWSPRQPAWASGLKDAVDYVARIQQLQQSGIPKVDIVIYNKESAWTLRTVYESSDLISRGWSYNYLTAENLQSEQAVVDNGVLAPMSPAWKALAIGPKANVSLDALASLQRLADSGLPIIMVGESPCFYPEGNKTDAQLFEKNLNTLQSSDNVYSADEGQLADKLSSLGVRPQVAVETNGTWYTTWRESEEMGHALIYSDLTASQGEVEIADTRTPFFLNPWTGEETPVLTYRQDNASTIIPLSLAGNQTVVIAFKSLNKLTDPTYHLTSFSPHVLGSTFDSVHGLTLQVAHSTSDVQVTLSNGASRNISTSSVPPAFELSQWSLTAEHWEAPANLSDVRATVKYNTTHELSSLVSWSEIPALVNASGIGYYTTSFTWPPVNSRSAENATLRAYLSFPNVLHALRVRVNGEPLPPLDLTNAVIDISPWLRSGNNTVTAIVPTTLWNYLRTVLGSLESAGAEPLLLVLGAPLATTDESGLLSGVRVTPLQNIVC
ncbi:hypothetical protein F5Y08DRAFT_351412 [Xylaria arbuscula]|nr:hypothetical protein F5Y08DRAFT_351412 [Xylaria arbuscula]